MFSNNYKHRNLYIEFVKKQSNGAMFNSAKEFENLFKEVMKPELTTSKFY